MGLSLRTDKNEFDEVLPPGLSGARAPAGPANFSEFEQLTPRELQVLELICDGNTSKEIANDLGISLLTAVKHRANIMQKVGLHNTAAVVRYAIRNGLFQP